MEITKKFFSENVLVLIDSRCVMCNGFAKLVLRLRNADTIYFGSLQNTELKDSLQSLGYTLPDDDSIVVIADTTTKKKSSAIFQILTHCNRSVRRGRVFTVFPVVFLDKIYDFVARNRYRLLGTNASCDIQEMKRYQKWYVG